jgi:3-oxoadipate enol-lactonase
VSSREVRSADGTSIRGWCNDGDGDPVLLCNGLGAPLAAWPRLVARNSGYRVVSWDYRGLGGSQRPVDRGRVRVEDHAADARAVLDAFGLRSATLVGWSLGVNVAFELALQDPARVGGVFAVAGVPGGSFSSLFAPLRVPRPLRTRIGHLSSWWLPVIGPLVPLVVAGLRPWEEALSLAARGGAAAPAAHLGALTAVLREFARHDWRWYRHLVAAVAAHAPLDVSAVHCPVTFLAGRYDSFVDVADLRTAARNLPAARYREVAGTHFLPLYYPELMLYELRHLTGTRSSSETA